MTLNRILSIVVTFVLILFFAHYGVKWIVAGFADTARYTGTEATGLAKPIAQVFGTNRSAPKKEVGIRITIHDANGADTGGLVAVWSDQHPELGVASVEVESGGTLYVPKICPADYSLEPARGFIINSKGQKEHVNVGATEYVYWGKGGYVTAPLSLPGRKK